MESQLPKIGDQHPVPTRKIAAREMVSRFVVQEAIYHQPAGGKVTSAGKPWHRILRTSEQAYQRTLVLHNNEWTPLDLAWAAPASMVLIECCKQGGDCDVGMLFNGETVLMFPVSSGESCRFEPGEGKNYVLRGPCKITITAIPR